MRDLTQRTTDTVEANLATPCPFNVGLLLTLAAGWAFAGDQAECARLIGRAEAIGMIGYGRMHAPHRLVLALARYDHDEIRRVVESLEPSWLTPTPLGLFGWLLWANLFDALAELDDRDRIEAEAPQWLRPDAYVAPFAVRALGIARRDATLLADAVARFEMMGLERHAQTTRARLERLSIERPAD